MKGWESQALAGDLFYGEVCPVVKVSTPVKTPEVVQQRHTAIKIDGVKNQIQPPDTGRL